MYNAAATRPAVRPATRIELGPLSKPLDAHAQEAADRFRTRAIAMGFDVRTVETEHTYTLIAVDQPAVEGGK